MCLKHTTLMLSIPGIWAFKKKIYIYKAGRASLGKLMELAHLVSSIASFTQAPVTIPSSS